MPESSLKMYKVTVTYRGGVGNAHYYNKHYCGLASSIEVASRAGMRLARAAELVKPRVTGVEELSDAVDFGLENAGRASSAA